MNVDVGLISELQSRTDRIRNVCVLAHVDHGKTTLSDHLIASNGLIHPKLAGEVRYMDSKDDEQARGITMKSSSISLLFVPGAATRADGPNAVPRAERLEQGYLFNLIDSPGHVDFCSEVSTAARLSDGAFVVVDAVEGVCIQTHAVLRQAWEEKVKLCLVVNKIDRLILELCLTPLEAYERLKAIIAHVNMIVSSFHSEKYISEADAVLAYEEAKADGTAQRLAEGGEGGADDEVHPGEEEEEEEEQAFAPERGNVVFGSAYDGWAFRINQFADMYAAKMGCKASALQRALWGDFAYQPKTKRIVRIKSDQQGRVKPLFVQLALEPIWKAYSACEHGADHAAILGRIVQGLGLSSITPRVLQHPDARAALRSVLRAWLPLSEAVLSMAAEHLPSPLSAAPERYARLLPPRPEQLKAAAAEEGGAVLASSLDAVEGAVRRCDTEADAPLVLYVSKMVAVPAAALPRLPGEPGPAHPAEERFLAFGRVFSGVIRQGQTVQVLPATYNPADPASERQEVAVGALFLMMGRGLERLPEVPAGNILAIAGLDLAILKSATVASTPLCRPLAPMLFQSAPIVRVAVEPARPGDMPALVEGLRLLHQADPMVQVAVQDTGEHVLCAAGEVHLETCIKDLKERFARCELVVSPPLVAFRETVFCREEAPQETTARPVFAVEASTPSGACTLRVMALPLPAPVATALDQNADLLRLALGGAAKGAGGSEQAAAHGQQAAQQGAAAAEADVGGGTGAPGSDSLASLGERLRTVAAAAEQEGLLPLLQRVWMFGPKRVGPNLLLAAPGGSADAAASSLFGLPPERVVKLAKQQPGRTALLPAAGRPESAASDAVDRHEEEEEAHEQRSLAVPLGFPEAALKLGLAASDETAASHAAAAIADLSSQLGAMDVNAAGAAAAPANGSAAADGAATGGATTRGTAAGGSLGSSLEYLRYSVESGVASGFQMAAAAGPLCDEPLWGVAFAVEARLNLPSGAAGSEGGSAADAAAHLHLAEDVYGPFSGQVTSAARQALRRAVLEADPRLVEALFLCEVATSSEGLSAVYAVLGRRRARILREEMREGSDLFTVHAYLPAEASFGFADELRRRSSGAATASLMLSHWERLQVDPFFVPLTEEEREEFGEEGQGVGSANLAKRLIDAVRRRKGLPVEEKVVESATKQRTRARKTDAGLACAELHPRGALILAGGEQGDLLVFATSNGNLLQRLADPSSKPSPVTSVAWAHIEGVEHVVAGHKNGSVRIWRLDRAAVVASLAAHRSDVGVLAVMAPLALLATGGADGNIKLWGMPTPEAGSQHPAKPLALKEPRQKLKGHAGELTALHFTPDGEQLISGDSCGGLRVWEVAGGAPKAGRLAHNLSGHHSGAISGLACHPDERLFVSCSADRTLRVWDMDGPVPSCINTHGPEGRREPRAVAFTPGGRALLAAYPDGLRTFTLDPLQLCDTADGLQWGKVRSIRYLDGKVVGLTLFKGDAGLHCIDLTRMKPFTGPAIAATTVESAVRCAAAPAVPPQAAPTSGPVPAGPTAQPTAGVPQPGPSAAAAAEQRRQVLEARTAGANGKGPAIEVHAPPLRHPRHATFTSASPSGRPPAAAGGAPPAAASTGQAGEGRGGRPPRVSAEENGGAERSFSGSKAELSSDSKFVAVGAEAAGPAAPSGQPCQPSMLALSSDRGFQQAAQEGGRQLCARLQASRALLREVKALLQRDDVQGVVRKLKDAGDLAVAARVLDSRVLQSRCPDRFSIELCAEAAPLCRSLLASPAAVHQQAALGLLDAVLGRWGDYMRGALSPAPSHRKVDLAAETRQHRSRVLQAALNAHVVPELGRLAAAPLGGGRAQQMLTRIRGL